MEFTVEQIAGFISGQVEGDAKTIINDVAKIEEGKPGALSFLANPKYSEHLYTCLSSAVIINKDFQLKQAVKPVLIRVEDAYAAFAQLLELYDSFKQRKTGVSPKAHIEESAQIGKEVFIGPGVYIGHGAEIGDNVEIFPNCYIGDKVTIGQTTTLHANVTVYHLCEIGNNCIIHAGSAIGVDGFGFAPQVDGQYKKIPQIGKVIIEDNVEIGANCTIDRATMGATLIREGAKIDNLVQVAHNVEVGPHTVIAAQTGIAGSAKLGAYCMVGGQVGFSGHITIADKVKIGAQSGISKSIKKQGDIIMGSPAFNLKEFYKAYAVFMRLPQLDKKLYQLTKTNIKQ